jgi:hypothetical protein
MNIKRNGSQASGKGNTDWFTGTVRIDQPFQADVTLHSNAGIASTRLFFGT